MDELGYLFVRTLGKFLVPVLVAGRTVNNLDLGKGQGLENENYESD